MDQPMMEGMGAMMLVCMVAATLIVLAILVILIIQLVLLVKILRAIRGLGEASPPPTGLAAPAGPHTQEREHGTTRTQP